MLPEDIKKKREEFIQRYAKEIDPHFVQSQMDYQIGLGLGFDAGWQLALAKMGPTNEFYANEDSWWWKSTLGDLANRIIITEDLSLLQPHNKHSLCGGKRARKLKKELGL